MKQHVLPDPQHLNVLCVVHACSCSTSTIRARGLQLIRPENG